MVEVEYMGRVLGEDSLRRYRSGDRIFDFDRPEFVTEVKEGFNYVRLPGREISRRKSGVEGNFFVYTFIMRQPHLLSGAVCVGKKEANSNEERRLIAVRRALEILPQMDDEAGYTPGSAD